MSFQAMTWAVEQQLPANQKIVLLMLANRTNHETGRCIPRIKTLADECGMSETTCKTSLKLLEEAGIIRIEQRFDEGVQKPNQYHLLMRGDFDGVGRNPTPVGPYSGGCGSDADGGVGRNPPTEPGSSNLKKKKEESAREKPSFDNAAGKIIGISDAMIEKWREAFPAIDVANEIAKAEVWLIANPKNRKSDYLRFLSGWMQRAQDKAPRVAAQQQHSAGGSTPPRSFPNKQEALEARNREVAARLTAKFQAQHGGQQA